jgi:hypothetical protein
LDDPPACPLLLPLPPPLQVERSHRASQEAALEAAHLAEERVLQQYHQALEELESAHEAEQEALVVG